MYFFNHAPLWCLEVNGPERLFLSYPTWDWDEVYPRGYLDTRRACVARCTYHVASAWICPRRGGVPIEAEDTPAMQCGAVARLDPGGRYLCVPHMGQLWRCAGCDAALPQGGGGWCSSACELAWEAEEAEGDDEEDEA
jgi:hypothetical protein